MADSERRMRGKVQVIACGMLAREILAVKERLRLDHLDLTCLPAELHYRPDRIPAAMEKAILAVREHAAGDHQNLPVLGLGGNHRRTERTFDKRISQRWPEQQMGDRIMNSKRIIPIVAIICVMTLSACANTVRGVGRDINATADAVEDSVE